MHRLLELLAAAVLAAASSPEPATPPPNCEVPSARPAPRTVLVYLQKEDIERRFPGDPRTYVAFARRLEPAETRAPLIAALRELLKGPTRRELWLGCRSIFSNDSHVLRGVRIVDGQAIVDFRRGPFFREGLNIASASHAGAVFMTQLELTIFQFPIIESIRYEFDGNCLRFGYFMQAVECVVVYR